MKVKVVLTKGFKNTKFTRTLNIDNRVHPKTAQTSLKDLTLTTTNIKTNNHITTTKNNLINTKINNTEKSNSKIKNNHISINAKDKEKNSTQILKNNTISNLPNINKYKKLNILEEKKKKYLKKEKSFSNYNIKRYKNDKDKKLLYKTPVKIRKIKSGIHKKITIDSKINNRYLNTLHYNANILNKNNNNIILNLKKELELLKKENIYKTMLINNMKQQIEEYRKQQEIIQENKLLKEEIILLKNNKTNNINKEKDKDIDLFDKLKNVYFNNQIQLNKLKKENDILKNNLHNKMNINSNKKFFVEKNIDIIYNDKLYKKNIYNNINNYIENKYKIILKKENDDINNYYKPLKEEQKKEIYFLIKMILLSNHISKDKILNVIFNNLINFNNIVNIIILDFLKTNSTFDKVLLKHYFTYICLTQKDNMIVFDINNLFNEINKYYNDIDDIRNNYNSQKIYKFLSNNENIKQLINECKFKDQFNVGIIEYNEFNEIFIGAYGNYINNSKNKELYNLLIYVMKNYYNLNELGLYYLDYQNLNCDTYQQKIQNIKSVNNKDNDNLGKNDTEIQDIFKNYYSSNNSGNNSIRSNKTKNKKKISNEDVIANVSINVEQSTALVNVKFKNHYDSSDYDNNSIIQTSINGINSLKSGKNNDISLLENKNNEDEENNILVNNEEYQICLDFVANIFEYCLDKLHRDEKNVNKIYEEDYI